jgi:hypothetical protein
VLADLFEIEIFEVAVFRMLNPDDDDHHFAQSQSGFPLSLLSSRFEKFSFDSRLESLAEIVNAGEKR